MNSIEQKAIETFQINLNYLAEKQPQVYRKIQILNQAIEDGSYTEKYSLEYKDEYFDILELASNHYLYNQNSIKHAKSLAKNVNYKKSEAVVEGFYNIQISDAEAKRDDGIVRDLFQKFAESKIIHYNASVTSRNDDMKDIIKFIFCGIGLGFHITEIQNKVKSSVLFIMEDNLEIFRLSLFTTNYQRLSQQARLFFSIMENEIEYESIFRDFFNQAYTHNHYIKYAMFSQNDIKKIKRIQDSIVKSRHLIRPYSKHLRELLKAPEYLVEKYPFINLSNDYSKISPLSNKPVLLIASGPSLGHNSKWLQENKDKFFIIAVLSSVRTLYALDVKPDIVTHIDAGDLSINLLDDVDYKSFFDKTIFLFSSVLSRSVIDVLPKTEVYFFETSSNYKKDSKIISMPSIGEITYAVSLILGSQELYLLGLDLALDPETKSDHSKEHIFASHKKDTTTENEQYTSLKDTVNYTKGNFLNEVPITPVYHMSVIGFGVVSRTYLTHNQRVFNLNNGAFLEGATPLHAEDLDTTKFSTLDKAEEFKQIKIFLDKISEDSMNKDDIENFDNQIKEAQRLLKVVEDFKKSVSVTNYDTYVRDFYALYNELLNLNKKDYDINHVFSIYLQSIVSYIFDIFNTKGLKNQKRHLKKINEIFIRQLIKILTLYLTTMRVYRAWIDK